MTVVGIINPTQGVEAFKTYRNQTELVAALNPIEKGGYYIRRNQGMWIETIGYLHPVKGKEKALEEALKTKAFKLDTAILTDQRTGEDTTVIRILIEEPKAEDQPPFDTEAA